MQMQVIFEVPHRVRSVVKDGGRQRRVGAAFGEDSLEIFGLPRPARGDHGNVRSP